MNIYNLKWSAGKKKKNDIQRVSADQHIERHECIPPMVRTSGTCRRLETNLTMEMSFDTGKEVEIFYTIFLE